jgi:protein-tyrosine phosphatase
VEITKSNSVQPSGYIDIHCHCLPGIDDGPADMLESLHLCKALADDGISKVVATPHQLGRFAEFISPEQIRQKVSLLNESLTDTGFDLSVLPGADVRVDERICKMLELDKILTLADGGKYILLEMPHEIFFDIEPLLRELSSIGVCSIISHPERHPFLSQITRNSPTIPSKWFDYPVYFQITAGSLLGEFGPQAESAAWYFVRTGLASLVASDAHDLRRRRPRMKDAFKIISLRLNRTLANRLCFENPSKVLSNQDIETPRIAGTRARVSDNESIMF